MANTETNAVILVVDDDAEIVTAISRLLERESYRVLKAYDGLQALEILSCNEVDLILMDLMMPRVDGLSAVMKIRSTKNIPIIILSAKTEDSDKVLGLTMGADDYIAKPYHPMELLARVRSQLRRFFTLGASSDGEGDEVLSVGGIQMNLAAKTLTVDGNPVKLTATEWKILELLMKEPGRVYSAEDIYRNVWKEDAYSVDNTIMVHVRRIREKIEIDPKAPRYLKVVWGIGYKIEK